MRKRLGERDAWAAALAWKDQLQGCVRLETDAASREAQNTIVPIFSWVTFVFNGSPADGLKEVKDAKAAAFAARAASIAWLALSCCAGYGGHENPYFWRRVFSELHALAQPKKSPGGVRRTTPYRPQRPISDAVRFFDGEDQTFPRVRIVPKFPQDRECLHVLLLAGNTGDRKLQKVLDKLQPFICQSVFARRKIPLAIEGLHIEEVARVVMIPPRSSDIPVFSLEMVVLLRQDTRYTTAIREVSIQCSAQIVVEDCEFSHLFHTHRGTVDTLLPNSAASSPCLFSTHTLSLTRSVGSRSKIAVVCSALPQIRSLTGVQLASDRMDAKALSTNEWAWLGYAIFHPDSSDSGTFHQLEIQLVDDDSNAFNLDIFKRMSIGNNLLSALQFSSKTVTSYSLARIGTSATARLDATNRTDLTAELDSDSWVTLCEQAEHVKKLDDWVRAVIPGYGLGWIPRSSIAELATRPPGRSCVRHLRLGIPDVIDQSGELHQSIMSSVLDLLSVLGEGLLSLDMSDSLPLNKDAVQSILYRCQSLRTLRICHDGEFWSQSMPEKSTPRLKELELSVDSLLDSHARLHPLRSSDLIELKTLRLRTLSPESFAPSHKTFLSTLALFPGIIFAHWLYARGPEYSSYEKRRLHSLSLQRQYDVGHNEVSQVPMTRNSKIAFVSVVHHKQSVSTALSRFDNDILSIICSFSTSPLPRSVFIGSDGFEIRKS